MDKGIGGLITVLHSCVKIPLMEMFTHDKIPCMGDIVIIMLAGLVQERMLGFGTGW